MCLDRKHLHERGEDLSSRQLVHLIVETPPRAWRRLTGVSAGDPLERNTSTSVEKTIGVKSEREKIGNTSTSVEKTETKPHLSPSVEKHLHERGEDSGKNPSLRPNQETPPRAWRRLFLTNQHHFGDGNTSTSVEKTQCLHSCLSFGKKHLHERGEDTTGAKSKSATRETPPRAWRRRYRIFAFQPFDRNTSTSVEKTYFTDRWYHLAKKHLHERGEDCLAAAGRHKRDETPPRAWRRLQNSEETLAMVRNTSTSVEKTPRKASA